MISHDSLEPFRFLVRKNGWTYKEYDCKWETNICIRDWNVMSDIQRAPTPFEYPTSHLLNLRYITPQQFHSYLLHIIQTDIPQNAKRHSLSL